MNAAGSETENYVAFRMSARGRISIALHRADRKAGKVVVALAVEARHLGGLAADQRGARHAATLGDTLDHARRDINIESGRGEIIEEEQRLRALARRGR